MRERNIQQSISIKQEPKDGEVMIRQSFRSFIQSLIREHSVYRYNNLSLFVQDLPEHDIKILLSHVVGPEEYEELCASRSAFEASFLDNKKYLQSLIDDEIPEVYHDAMREMGVHFDRYPDNGELYPVRRVG